MPSDHAIFSAYLPQFQILLLQFVCHRLYETLQCFSFFFFFGPLIPGTKIHNVVKVVKESGRDAKFRKHEEHYLSGVLLLAPSYILLFL